LTRFDEHFAFDSDEFEFLYTKKIPDSEESAWKKIVNKLLKHRQGQHDQSTHGGKSGFNVPSYVDIEGKRYSDDAVNEFRKRLVAYEEAHLDKVDEICVERFGKPWSELNYSQQEEARATRRYDESGNYVRNPDGSIKEFLNVGQEASQDPKVAELQNAVNDHYLMKDAMGQLAWNADGTLGPATIGEQIGRYGESYDKFTTRMLRTQGGLGDTSDYSKPTNVLRRDEKGNYLRDEDNGRVVSESVLVSREVAERIHAEEWQAFGEAAYPEVIVSNKALRSILASGEFKSYTEADRPARAGGTDEGYKNSRSVYESVAFGYDNTVETANRPVSGLLTATDPHQDILQAYGNTQVILKPSVLARSTVTLDDSLNGFHQPKTVASFLATPSKPYTNKTVASDVQVNGKGYYTNRSRGVYNNPEIQIHGGVRVSDIATVVFRDTVPTAIATKLDTLGIPYEVRKIGDVQE
jgi:hypothetical protein